MSKIKFEDKEDVKDEKNLEIPELRIKDIHFKNFKVFEDVKFIFSDNFSCFYGPNGCGKTTVLDTIQLLFFKFEGYDKDRIHNMLKRAIRKNEKTKNNNFYIKADFEINKKEIYTVELDSWGFITEHPPEIKNYLKEICFYAKFDQELSIGTFQILRKNWFKFKNLFESITGFEIKESEPIIKFGENDPKVDLINKEWITDFIIYKPNETITHKECSAGEKKIIKTFSTLLSKNYEPKIILIDNVAMHVESGRHINLISTLKESFKESQILSTTHSYHISRNFGNKNQLYDLRLIKSSNVIKKEPWRNNIIDEIKDTLIKLKSLNSVFKIEFNLLSSKLEDLIKILIEKDLNDEERIKILKETRELIYKVEYLHMEEICNFKFNQIVIN